MGVRQDSVTRFPPIHRRASIQQFHQTAASMVMDLSLDANDKARLEHFKNQRKSSVADKMTIDRDSENQQLDQRSSANQTINSTYNLRRTNLSQIG
jgi:hypothetical protein